MIRKPVNARQHGIIDYIFSGIQLCAPSLLGLDRSARATYALLGAAFATVNALTDTPVGLKRTISMKNHQRADAAFLAGLVALGFTGLTGRSRKAGRFHRAFLATAIAHYLLTDYEQRGSLKRS